MSSLVWLIVTSQGRSIKRMLICEYCIFCGRELYGIGRIGCYYFLLRCYAGRPIAKSFTRPCSSAFLGYNGFNRLLNPISGTVLIMEYFLGFLEVKLQGCRGQ